MTTKDKIGLTVAIIIVVATFCITIFEGVVALCQPSDEMFGVTTKVLLPLWGTWIGAIIAFYFSKSNLEKVSASYDNVIEKLTPQEKMAQMPLSKVMVPIERMETLDYEDSLTLSLDDILNHKSFTLFNRFVFIDDDKMLRKMIHRKNITQYIADKLQEGVENPLKITFAEFLDECSKANPKRQALWGFATVFVAENATVLDAKTAIFSISHNRDVFVTHSGEADEAIIGMVTDEDILKAVGQ